MHAAAREPGKGASLDEPGGAAPALDDARRRARELGRFLQRSEGFFALLYVRVGASNTAMAGGFLLPRTGFVY